MGSELSLGGNWARQTCSSWQRWLEGWSCLWNILGWRPGSWVFFIISSSSQKEPKKKQQLSICNKLCYAVGGAPYQVTGCALGFFLQIYLLDVAQVSGMSLPGLLQHPEVGRIRDCSICEMGLESLLCCLSESAADKK